MATSPDLTRIAGPESMAKPDAPHPASTATDFAAENSRPTKSKKRHRAGKKKKNNRASVETTGEEQRPSLLDAPVPSESFYRLRSGRGSNTSLESEALLDHREHGGHGSMRPRRQSLQQSGFTRPSLPSARIRGSNATGPAQHRSRLAQLSGTAISEDEDDTAAHDSTPLLASSRNHSRPHMSRTNSGHYGTSGLRHRKSSVNSRTSSKRKSAIYGLNHSPYHDMDDEYDVNNPPSVPHSPQIGSMDDIMVNNQSRSSLDRGRDAVINIDEDDFRLADTSPEALRRRPTVHELATRDVCFPHHDDLSDIGEEFERKSTTGSTKLSRMRTRTRPWPDLDVLDEWAREEKEERTYQDDIRAKKISEPVMVGGRLRPVKTPWHREEDAPFRFTYFNEMFDGTIHARTISDLLQEGATFKDLFQPDPVELPDDSEEEDDEGRGDRARPQPSHRSSGQPAVPGHVQSQIQSRQPSIFSDVGDRLSPPGSKMQSRSDTPSGENSNTATPMPAATPKQYGPRPTFWLDVLQPTEIEMKIIAKAFGIHQLTIEDILMEEQREKVELFQNYYFLNYRSFEQDKDSPDHMDPVNFYVVVFRDGVITFHHSQTPHPANVRRRIRQLGDYMSPTSDWISYALIDDITDVYAPRVAQIEEDVDEIDEQILYLHVTSADEAEKPSSSSKPAPPPPSTSKSKKWFKFLRRRGSNSSNQADASPEDRTTGMSGGDMLRRVGECRKDVMSLYRLLGNKADVIKGFAKRCNENWQVAPRSEIGLYLGDIQDHIVTMSSNLGHYESLLSRAHSNYVAQINIRMNERAEQNADILGKLTVIGTIVLPMNIITGMWGMNVWVPGQEYEGDLTWFFAITAGLILFGVGCFFGARKVYGIV